MSGDSDDDDRQILNSRLAPGERSDPQGFPGTDGSINCPFSRPVACNPRAKYRTITGLCNNLKNPRFGSANTPFERSLPSVYNDGKSYSPLVIRHVLRNPDAARCPSEKRRIVNFP